MKNIITITLLVLSTSCAHRLTTQLPELNNKSENQAIETYKNFKIEKQNHKEMIFNHINMKNKAYTISSSKYLFNYVNENIYPQLIQETWGKYLAWFSLIPLYFFTKKSVEEGASLTNVSLSLISATGFFYGLSLELEKNNKLIDKYNQDLKIKLNLIDLPL